MSQVCNLSEINWWEKRHGDSGGQSERRGGFGGSRFVGEWARVIFASALGTVFEWYEFYLYVVLEERRILVRRRKEQLCECRRTARQRSKPGAVFVRLAT
jgi:hypothetical protein